jgi:hypothetical protein
MRRAASYPINEPQKRTPGGFAVTENRASCFYYANVRCLKGYSPFIIKLFVSVAKKIAVDNSYKAKAVHTSAVRDFPRTGTKRLRCESQEATWRGAVGLSLV